MFTNQPKILAHIKSLDSGNYITQDYILNKSDGCVNLLRRHCPHRLYPITTDIGQHTIKHVCKFHGFEWDINGKPTNNDKKLNCGTADIGRSGLILKNFTEPKHSWVDDLANEKELVYSHSITGTSKGSYLWLMDAEADLLHVYKEGIHPLLSQQINLDDIIMEQGDGWILQTHPDGWWLYVFPYSFVEYGRNGMVMVNNVTPHNNDSEFGFDWITQFYYNKDVEPNRRLIFETLDQVFKEDVGTAELQLGKYFPLTKAMNRYEDHCVHFGEWVRANKIN